MAYELEVVLVDDPVCPITLEPLASLRNPVVFRLDNDPRVVYELDVLLKWLLINRIHPITRESVTIQRDFIVPINFGGCDRETKHKIRAFVQAWGQYNCNEIN